jgi:hypothetical protein
MAFCGYLKQSATPTIVLGPFLDATDGVTAETALTISQADVRLSKNGAAFAQIGEATSATHMEAGYYSKLTNATDTGTLGVLTVAVAESGALPVRHDFLVVTADEWDRLHDTVGAVPAFGILDRGTAQSATSTTLVLRAAATFADDTTIGATLMAFGSTQGYWQTRSVTDYVLSTDTATVDAWTVTPSGTITYVLLAGAPSSASSLPAVNVTQIAGQTASAAAAVTFPATVASTTNITAGTITTATNVTTLNGIAANVVTASALATDAVTEIQAGLATSAALATVSGYLDTEVAAILAAVDTEVAAIKAKTDSLTFTKALELDANVQSFNGVTLTGDGSAGDKFDVV